MCGFAFVAFVVLTAGGEGGVPTTAAGLETLSFGVPARRSRRCLRPDVGVRLPPYDINVCRQSRL